MLSIDQKQFLRHPVVILGLTVLFMIPYLNVDFQHCYLNAKNTYTELSFNYFMSNTLFRKFAVSLVMTLSVIEWVWRIYDKIEFQYEEKVSRMISKALRGFGLMIMGSTLVLIIKYSFSSTIDLIYPSYLDTTGVFTLGFVFSDWVFIAAILSLLILALSFISYYKSRLKVNFKLGNFVIIYKEDRKYFGISEEGKQERVNTTLDEMEKKLPKDRYVRANRSALVRLDAIKEVFYWENDKYIMKVNAEKNYEFTLSRYRWKKIRPMVNEYLRSS